MITLAYTLLAAMLAALLVLPPIWSHLADALLWAAVQAKAVEKTLSAVPGVYQKAAKDADGRVKDVA